jgi:hypothetical protein
MAEDRSILFADLAHAAARRDPQFVPWVLEFLAQPDPSAGQPEDPPDDFQAQPLPPDAWSLERLRQSLNPQALAGKTADELKARRLGAWAALLASANPPPRLKLGQLLLDLYAADDEPARALLLELIPQLPPNALGWGVWQGIKGIYKQAEQRHDLAILGALCCRLDVQPVTGGNSDISRGTWLYMRRRAWRFLRQLGQALPELFPVYAGQVLRHYPPQCDFRHCWIANQIWRHKDLIGATDQGILGSGGLPDKDKLDRRAFDDAWKISPAPLLRLLEDARNPQVCEFAIRCLEQDFKDALRHVEPAWLARLGGKRLDIVHDFVIKLLRDNPEFHQSKLKPLGLHDMVLGLLYSGNSPARRYAIDYARAYATDLPVAELVKLVRAGMQDAQIFAVALLEQRTPAELGLPTLLQLLTVSASVALAKAKLRQGFKPQDITAEQFVEVALAPSGPQNTSVQLEIQHLSELLQRGVQNADIERALNRSQRGGASALDAVLEFYREAKVTVPAAYYRQLLDDPRCTAHARQRALTALADYPGHEIGSAWLQQALLSTHLGKTVASWLRQGKLKGEDLDVEWLKGLALRPALRPLALHLLGDSQLVAPTAIGLPWLLAMARQADPTLHDFAHRYLLQSFQPGDFASGDRSGVDHLWELACGPAQPEPVRRFAAAYLKAHHPRLGPSDPETRALNVKPALTDADYPLNRLRPLFEDHRPDLRRLAVAIAREELPVWNEPALLYRLADSEHREPRAFAIEQLLRLGETSVEPALPMAWLLPERVFQLAESRHKITRETALTLIRRHRERLGEPARLAWLMESPHREVGLFTVRLLWESQRRKFAPTANAAETQPGAPTEELRQFLRKTLFGLPPGRMERRELDAEQAAPDRPWPASVGKWRLVEAIKTLALEDAAFAALVTPVLEEFRHSRAKHEWQHCVAALVQIRRAHPAIRVELPVGQVNVRAKMA